MTRAADLERLRAIMARLRAEDGCPWDRRQTLATLRPYLLEEAYEVLEALDGGSPAQHAEELGDLLFQVVFQARLREEAGAFDLADVVDAIADKLVRRHPHVFGDEDASDHVAVAARWEELKAAEGGGKGTFAAIGKTLPALMRAEKVGAKAARLGFDWPEVGGALDKLMEELGELREAIASGDGAARHHELGDVLFSVVNVARHIGVHPEEALRDTTGRFQDRFASIEAKLAARALAPGDVTLAELDRLWEEAKAEQQRRHPRGAGPPVGGGQG